MKIEPSASRSCIQVNIVPVISVLTPLRSVPVPAKALPDLVDKDNDTRGLGSCQ
jgi:hypothetical protein